jgi:hypothetical protein
MTIPGRIALPLIFIDRLDFGEIANVWRGS